MRKVVAFPRLNLSSFYLWLAGTAFFLIALFSTGLDTGWTFLHSLFDIDSRPSCRCDHGCVYSGFSSIFKGLNFIVTINTMRPPGMTWFRMPFVPVGNLFHLDYSGSCDTSSWYHRVVACARVCSEDRYLRPSLQSVTQLLSNTSSGSTLIPPFTS